MHNTPAGFDSDQLCTRDRKTRATLSKTEKVTPYFIQNGKSNSILYAKRKKGDIDVDVVMSGQAKK